MRAHVVDLTEVTHAPLGLVGGKAQSLGRMRALGLRVPPAFVIPADVCATHVVDRTPTPALRAAVAAGVARLEDETGRRFGAIRDRLLVSVRSGAGVSMPGMMDTVLNVGTAASDSMAEASLLAAIGEVVASWETPRARHYRRVRGIPDQPGTAVTIQAMVFGDAGPDSGSGVVFSRDPGTGDARWRGDVLRGAQGHDVVSGTRLCLPIEELDATWPEIDRELRAGVAILERAWGDAVDVEFTIEEGVLHYLQCRPVQPTAAAAARIAVDLADEGLISRTEARLRISRSRAAHPGASTPPDPALPQAGAARAHGVAACPGTATGQVCLTADAAEEAADAGHTVILVRPTTTPDDIHGFEAAAGVVTSRGGFGSHAAILARELDLPAVVGASDVALADDGRSVRVGDVRLRPGDLITVDGWTGAVYDGAVALAGPPADSVTDRLVAWAQEETA